MKPISITAFLAMVALCLTTKMCVAWRGDVSQVLDLSTILNSSFDADEGVSAKVVNPTEAMKTSSSSSKHIAIAFFAILAVVVFLTVQTERSSKFLLTLGCVAMLTFGSINVLAKDSQTKMGFYHPYLWTMTTFVAQSVFSATYRLKSQKEAQTKASKPPAPLHTYALITLFDYVTLCLINVGYTALPGSVLQLIKGVKLICTVILNVTLLQKTLKSFMYCGVCFTMVGLSCVFLATRSGDLGWADGAIAGKFLFIGCLSSLAGAFQFVYEEKAMEQYAVEPELLIGMEVIIGTCYGAIVLVVVNALKAENCSEALSILRDRREVLIAFLIFSFSVAAFSYSSLIVTKHSSSILRSLVDVGRTSAIWLIEICFAWVNFSWLELVGFLMVITGTLIYSQLLKVPCLAYD